MYNQGICFFCDDCAVVVISQEFENEIIQRVLGTFKNEKEIINDILEGRNVFDICDERGNF